jgi:hypothetical protein
MVLTFYRAPGDAKGALFVVTILIPGIAECCPEDLQSVLG